MNFGSNSESGFWTKFERNFNATLILWTDRMRGGKRSAACSIHATSYPAFDYYPYWWTMIYCADLYYTFLFQLRGNAQGIQVITLIAISACLATRGCVFWYFNAISRSFGRHCLNFSRAGGYSATAAINWTLLSLVCSSRSYSNSMIRFSLSRSYIWILPSFNYAREARARTALVRTSEMVSVSISHRGGIDYASIVWLLPSSLKEMEPRFSAARVLTCHSLAARCLLRRARTGVFKT